MQKMILTTYPVKEKSIPIIALLDKGKPISIPAMRKALKGLDLDDRLILCTDPKISKLFKADYGTNDHGIYYDVDTNPGSGKAINAVIVPLEQQTKERDFERFLGYDDFVDPTSGYSVSSDLNSYFAKSKEDHFILDIETTGLDFTVDKITMLSVKELGRDEILICDNPSVDVIKGVFSHLEGKKVIGHNLVFDLSWTMYNCGLVFAPIFQTIDTMLLAHVAGERRLSLKHLSMMYGNFKGRRNTLTADHAYLIEDMLTTETIYEKFKDHYTSFSGRLVCEAVKTFSEIKVAGLEIDQDKLFGLRDDYQHLEQEGRYSTSNRELAAFFLKEGVPLFQKTEGGDFSVARPVLEYFKSYPIVEEYLDYKAELSIYQKYIKPYCELDSFILRPNLKLAGTDTGRLSCSDPNVQQIPNKSKFKDIFRSRFEGGFIATIDLDRAELGIAALLSGDDAYAEAMTTQDFHSLVARKTFQKEDITKAERFTAKAVNFGGVLYGGSAKGIASRIGVETEIVAKIQDWYKKEYSTLTNWIEDQKSSAVTLSSIQTYFGRNRVLDGLREDQKRRIGVNTAVQSVASDVMLYIIVKLSLLLRKGQLRSKILFPVHDELLLDIHPLEIEEVIKLLEDVFKSLLETPIGKLKLSETLPISGTLEWGESWLYLKSEKYQPIGSKYISSLGPK